MKNAEISALRKEIAALRKEVADVQDALNCESANVAEHFAVLYRFIAELHEYLMPVVRKMFPTYTGKKYIDEFMVSYGGSATKKR